MIEGVCRHAAWLAALVLGLAALPLHATTLTIGVLARADDERLDPHRVELAYLGHPGGPLLQSVDVAIKESQFELDAAGLLVKVDAVQARDASEAATLLQRLERSGAAAIVLDLPAEWIARGAPAVRVPLLNAGEPDDTLRAGQCQPNLLHTYPSERMRADALAQTLASRRWSRVLLLYGPSQDDTTRLATVQASIKRFGLKPVAARAFKLSADPRERDLANPLLLTANVDYDVVWVIDSDGEFARSLPYRISLPRPVVGDGGLFALAWAPNFERFGAPQLARRFLRGAGRPMTGHDWAGWIATKAILQAALDKAFTPAAQLKAFVQPGFTLDGFKGVRLSFRTWDRQLRQPLLLTDGQGVVALAPAEGILHPSNVLDTLGGDAPEGLCKTR
ncbi:MAG TPA: branched-chain amino acid ABC transporter substrate-binding protein [Burkholderiaceae bacterium]|nr:branched-chain amino acid ABC transporter substrate-binding protein [Burkholderiaceae bacterium]